MSKTALIIVDMVNDFTLPDGLVYYPENRNIIPKISRVLEVCREAGMQIIFMQHRYRAEKYDKNLLNMRKNCIEGSGGEDIDSALKVDYKNDYVIPKRRYSGFFGTDLDLVLREHDVKNVVIVGTKTNCCIRATATDAYYLDYNTIVLSDCVATNSDIVNKVHLEDIDKYIGEVITSEELFEKIRLGEL